MSKTLVIRASLSPGQGKNFFGKEKLDKLVR